MPAVAPSAEPMEDMRTAEPPGATPPITLPVVGSYGNGRLFRDLESRFWRERVPALSGGTVRADLVAFDSSGIRGQDMLHLVRLGVVPVGTVLLGLAAIDEPELGAPNLALLSPDIGTLRRVVQAYRSHLSTILRTHYGAELLAVYTYPAQVLFCTTPLPDLTALRGRRVRVSQPSQGDVVEALGGRPVLTAFTQLRDKLSDGRMDCVITGSSTGNEVGLQQVAAQMHGMPISWGLSVSVANLQAWEALPASLRATLRRGLEGLEQDVWMAAARDTENGFRCNAGHPDCREGTPGHLLWEPPNAADETLRRRLLAEVVLPGWIGRCGEECRVAWNTYLAPMTRIFVPPAGTPAVGQPGGAEGGSAIVTGGLPASMIAPAASSTSSR